MALTFLIPGTSIQSGRFSGREGVGRYFSIDAEHTSGTHRVEVLDVATEVSIIPTDQYAFDAFWSR